MLETLNTFNESISDIDLDKNLDEHFNVLRELHYLNSIPELISSIHEIKELDDSSFSEEIEW
ncbi:hypothetical protein [Sulfurimonas sp. C5]|uniref:hypothetical protein n=1 Tax=Sulfurimonas sp. C5 TaxID=3036947 RepID=UPI0024555571|nr:hypothetical protein [Sulfurimonas sp. C5]MDH4943662.1 hypothetical protein [Sulfurimonas sp. C5]